MNEQVITLLKKATTIQYNINGLKEPCLKSHYKQKRPQIKVNGHMIYLSHIISEAFDKPLINGLQVNHKCNNAWCIESSHLYQGTQQDNMIDKANSDIVKGMGHNQAVLSDDDVFHIRELYESGMTQVNIAGRYSISQPNVSYIVNNRRWSHI